MKHFLSGIDLSSDTPTDFNEIIFGAGCFWGVERKFWVLEGVWLTSVGYAGGNSINPTYEQVCYEETNHVEVVKVVYDPAVIKIDTLLKTFWECHDPTQGMRQGNDRGTQYRSVIYCSSEEDLDLSLSTMEKYQEVLSKNNYQQITTEILLAPKFYLAEEYHQQYLAKNPNGYCGLGGTGCALDI
ncbi:MAG: peptide-methionine (S)-S-oxide reductase MsrA [Proteobacteria bacterium]|jgi:peptide-methionine (S)-S-oxide reductase|nr:peptide-methionine (S)-S-oxide reductase MsrA [Pseudomonadota bacterium]|tara:strand:+ start:285 stop:839 length:555 start_codon:yes stop_codon:yes gene_type:complete